MVFEGQKGTVVVYLMFTLLSRYARYESKTLLRRESVANKPFIDPPKHSVWKKQTSTPVAWNAYLLTGMPLPTTTNQTDVRNQMALSQC